MTGSRMSTLSPEENETETSDEAKKAKDAVAETSKSMMKSVEAKRANASTPSEKAGKSKQQSLKSATAKRAAGSSSSSVSGGPKSHPLKRATKFEPGKHDAKASGQPLPEPASRRTKLVFAVIVVVLTIVTMAVVIFFAVKGPDHSKWPASKSSTTHHAVPHRRTPRHHRNATPTAHKGKAGFGPISATAEP